GLGRERPWNGLRHGLLSGRRGNAQRRLRRWGRRRRKDARLVVLERGEGSFAEVHSGNGCARGARNVVDLHLVEPALRIDEAREIERRRRLVRTRTLLCCLRGFLLFGERRELEERLFDELVDDRSRGRAFFRALLLLVAHRGLNQAGDVERGDGLSV